MENYNQNIKKRREQLGLTPAEMAVRCGWNSSTRVYHIETEAKLTIASLEKIAEALETSVASLINGKDLIVDANGKDIS